MRALKVASMGGPFFHCAVNYLMRIGYTIRWNSYLSLNAQELPLMKRLPGQERLLMPPLPLAETFKQLLTRRVVLVLGAGASAPYGFPTGKKLWESLKGWAASHPHTIVSLKNAGFDEELAREFLEAVRLTNKYRTVDHFLEAMTNFREIGAFSIVSILAPLERQEALFQNSNWYEDFFDGIGFENDECAQVENLSIVTFNYERSLEHFLHKNIRVNTPFARRGLALSRLAKLKIVHAHGDFAEYTYPNYSHDGSNVRALLTMAERLRLVADTIEDTANFQQAQALVAAAETIIFLGFGYDPRTVSRLFAKSDASKQRAAGTALHLNSEEIDRVCRLVGRNFMPGPNMDAQLFLRALAFDNHTGANNLFGVAIPQG
jgi:hypothetical protein